MQEGTKPNIKKVIKRKLKNLEEGEASKKQPVDDVDDMSVHVSDSGQSKESTNIKARCVRRSLHNDKKRKSVGTVS